MLLKQLILRRRLHTVPSLPYDHTRGVPGLFSAEAMKTAWTDYQQWLLNKLNNLSVDTSNEARVPFHILLNTANDGHKAHIFNFASQAYNNHLFFSSLQANGKGSITKPSPALQRRIDQCFGGTDGLRKAFVEESNQLYSQGWIFLIEKLDKTLAIMTCQNAGTPFHWSRQQSVDVNGSIGESELEHLNIVEKSVRSNVKNYNIALLALNLWQHAYIHDYGVDGKEKYVDAWWETVDWRTVSDRLFD